MSNAGIAILSAKNIADFRRSLRAATRRYWVGLFSDSDFIFELLGVIDRQFNRAFNIGLAECGLKRADIEDGDDDDLQDLINNQFQSVANIPDKIIKKKDGGKQKDAYLTTSIYLNRFDEARLLGSIISCGDELREWVIGSAEHCGSCLKLNGIVKPLSFWKSSGILPAIANAAYLICKGFNCKCRLKKTNKPITKGALPSLP